MCANIQTKALLVPLILIMLAIGIYMGLEFRIAQYFFNRRHVLAENCDSFLAIEHKNYQYCQLECGKEIQVSKWVQ